MTSSGPNVGGGGGSGSAGAIRAGAAFVELFLKDESLYRDLERAEAHVRAVAAVMARVPIRLAVPTFPNGLLAASFAAVAGRAGETFSKTLAGSMAAGTVTAATKVGGVLGRVISAGSKLEGVGGDLGKVSSGFAQLGSAASSAGGLVGGRFGRAMTGVGGLLDKSAARVRPLAEWFGTAGAGAREAAEGIAGLRNTLSGALGAFKTAGKAAAGFALLPAKLATAPVRAGASLFAPILAAGRAAAASVAGRFAAAWNGLGALAANNPVLRALRGIEARAKSAGAAVRNVGLGMAGAGAAGYAALDVFDEAAKGRGNALLLLSDATGSGVEELSKLAFAAEKAGVPFEQMKGTLEAWSSRLSRAADGGDETFDKLRMSAGQIRGLLNDPTAALGVLADRLARVGKAADRKAIADDLGLGPLLPLLDKGAAGLRELTDEAADFGAVMSREDAEKAREATVLWNTVLLSLKSAVIQVGKAMQPTLEEVKKYTGWLKTAAGVVGGFIERNREIAGPLQMVALGVGVAGAGLAALGVVGSAVGAGIGVLASALSAAGAAAAFVLSPVGLLTAGVVGGTAAFLTMTDTGKGLVSWLTDSLGTAFDSVASTATEAFDGIADALEAGNIELAGKVAMAALNVEFTKACGFLTKTWNEFKSNFIKGWAVITKFAGDKWGDFQTNFAKGLAVLGYKLGVLSYEQGAAMTEQLDATNAADKANRAADYVATVDAANAELADAQRRADAAAQDALAAARAEFAALNQQAADLREKRQIEFGGVEERTKNPGPRLDERFSAMARNVKSVTLSSGSLATFGQALGVGDNIAKRQYDETKKTAENTKTIAATIKDVKTLLEGKEGNPGLVWG